MSNHPHLRVVRPKNDSTGAGQPPASLEAERHVLGAILYDNVGEWKLFDRTLAMVTAEDFWLGHHQEIFRAMIQVHEMGAVPSLAVVGERLKASGKHRGLPDGYFANLVTDYCGTWGQFDHYIQIVRDTSALRKAWSWGQQLCARIENTDIVDVPGFLRDEHAVVAKVAQSVQRIKIQTNTEALAELTRDGIANAKRGGATIGVPTGFPELDRQTGGLRPDHLIIVGARPGTGKTAFATQVAVHAARWNYGVLFMSIEMNHKDVVGRAVCNLSGISFQHFERSTFTSTDIGRVEEAARILRDIPLVIDETRHVDIRNLRGIAIHHRDRMDRDGKKLGLIVVDYAQRMQPTRDAAKLHTTEQLKEISRGLKQLALELHIPVLALAQLKREAGQGSGKSDRRPVLSDLKGTGDFEQDADLVLLLHRDEKLKAERKALLIVAKSRFGEEGVIPMKFSGGSMTFTEEERYQ